MSEYMNMLSGYKDRVARIALFDIFHQLENKLQKDAKERPIDFFGIGLLGILFFFENMLMRNKKTGVKELGFFLKKMTEKHMALDEEGYLNLAKQLIEVFRPPSGKRNSRSFFDYENGESSKIEYAILRADYWDPESNIQYYTLAEEGLELVFATKEYFSEFQISISQLVLRKQLEKGEFSGALRQVEEMRISVNTIKDKMSHIKHDIQRNIISDDTYERYKEIIGDINRRLQQEHDEFSEIMSFIKITRSHLDHPQTHSEKELKALELIVRVDNELAHVHFLHSSLLSESIELKTTAIEAAGESLYYAGVTSFNFDHEIARKMMTAPLPFEVGKVIAAPFMPTRKFKTWSLLTVFEPQMTDQKEAVIKHDFLEAVGDQTPSNIDIMQKIYKMLLKEMMSAFKGKDSFSLKELYSLKDKDIFGTREFFDMWLIMHQRSPMSIPSILEKQDHIFNKAFSECLSQYTYLNVIELEDEIAYKETYVVKNMQFTLGSGEINE